MAKLLFVQSLSNKSFLMMRHFPSKGCILFMESKEDEEISISAKKSKISGISENSDEEFSIDFGKIKKFFKGKGEKEPEDSPKTEKTEDEEIAVDFSKVKNFFKSGEKERGSEDINVDWSKFADFFKTYGIVLIALIPIILSIYVRMQADTLPFADDWASNSVFNNIRNQIRNSIDQQYPNLPSANKDALVETEMQNFINQNKQQIDQQVKGTSDYVKSFFQDENGNNYMPDIDPYYWVRYADNIVDHGYPGDVLVEGKSYDNRQVAPKGRFVTGDMFHSYFLAYFYKFLHLFSPSLTLIRSSFYAPVFLSALCVLLVFLIARKIAGNTGALMAGLIMAVNSAFLGRTMFGHADNDGWVIFFPLIVTWLFIQTIDATSIAKVIISAALAGFFTGLFTLAWSGWWFIFDFLLITVAVTFLYLVLTNLLDIRKNLRFLFQNTVIRDIIIFGIVYFIATAMFTTFFSGWGQFSNSFLGPLSFKSIKEPVSSGSLWPNVLTTVAELNEGSFNGIANSVGGYLFFYISLIGLLLAVSRTEGLRKFDFYYNVAGFIYYAAFLQLVKAETINSIYTIMAGVLLPVAVRMIILIYHKDRSYDFKLSLLLSLWIVSTIFASIKGIRFTLLLAPAFSVAFGVALGKLYMFSSKLLNKELKINKIVGNSVLILLILSLVYVNPTKAAIGASSSDPPIVNDAWYSALTAIKEDSKPDAIITSWWDFGHHFKSITDRRVTFDGTTQTYPPAHWVGKLLMSDNENQSLGILRMMDCSSNDAYVLLQKLDGNDTHLSIKIINEIVGLDKKSAEKKLMGYKFSDEKIKELLSYTHCDPAEGYFIASDDMIGKSGVWGHFGSWNFERADIWQNARNMAEEDAVQYMAAKFNYSRQNAQNLYVEMQEILGIDDANKLNRKANEWVAPWPGYAGTINCARNGDGIFECPQLSVGKDNSGRDVYASFFINMTGYDVFGKVGGTEIRANPVAFTTEDGIYKKQFDGNTFGLGFTVIPAGEDSVLVVMSSPQLVGSMFTRMFYMQGHGLKYFKLFNHPSRGLTGTDIYVYKVDWDGKNATIVEPYVDNLRKQTEATAIIPSAEPAANSS